MGRMPCCSKEEMKRGAWTAPEDKILRDYVAANGEGKWAKIPKQTGLKRCGKSCRLRWLNYLRPDIKRGNITPDEEDLIIRLHRLLGNRWSLIAGRLPGRTDNEIKNYWNSNLSKRARGSLNRERNYQSRSFTNAIEPEMTTPGPGPQLPIPLPENPPMVLSTFRTNSGAANDLRAMEYEPSNASSSTSVSRDDQSCDNVVMGHDMDDMFYSIDFLSFDDKFDFGNLCSVTELDWEILGCVDETDLSHFDSTNHVEL